MVPELRKYQIRIPREILGWNSGLTFGLAQKIKKSIFWSRDSLRGHVIVPDLRKYQIRIPRKILGRNSGLTFVLAQKLKKSIFWSRELFRGSRYPISPTGRM